MELEPNRMDPPGGGEEGVPQTALDQMVCDDRSQMLKALVPYVSARGQRLLSVCAKAMELNRTLRLFSGHAADVQICAAPTADPVEMIADIRRFTGGNGRRQMDQLLNMMAAFEMIKLMNEEDDIHG